MKIAIFGASGATGQILTDLCLTAGHHVSALVRNPATFPFADRVRVVKDARFRPATVREVIAGSDGVLSALGPRTLRQDDVIQRALPMIVREMNTTGVRRIVVLGAAGAKPGSLALQPAPIRWLMQHLVYDTILKWPLTAQKFQYETLSSSDLDWTMVLPPRLTNGRLRGRYRVAADALPPGGMKISRADIADFMIHQLTDSTYLRQAVYTAW